MNFDWTKPVVIDWSGRRGPLISEDDIKNSVIKRILHNQFYPPFCERDYVPIKPWWNPQDPFGSNFQNSNNKYVLFIPGLRPLPAYPQLSTLTKQQHLQGLKVMSTRFEFVQPRNYPKPTQKDITTFEEFQALYEAEQKEYLKWAKILWLNGDCLRVLRPKPTIERVYDAEFRMRSHEMASMPQSYWLAAQIPLRTEGDCEMEVKGDLVNVNVQDLPMVDYPEEMESEFSVLMKSCPVPEPCKEHPCKFVLPHEETVSVLPLAEIHRELAQYAASNGSTFVASENALRCLLDTDRSWKIPVSVVEVICPEYGDLKTIVVLGSEFDAQKECSRQRTYKAYKHLLRHTFAPSIGQYKSKSPTKQSTSPQKPTSSPPANKEPIVPRNNHFVPLHNDLEVSSDKDVTEKLLITDGERKNEPKKLLELCEPTKEPDRIDKSIEKLIDQCIESDNLHELIDEPSSEQDQLMIDNFSESNTISNNDLESFEAIEQCNKPDESQKHIDVTRNQHTQLTVDSTSAYSVPSYGLDFYEPDFNKDNTISYSHNEPFRLMDNSKPESSCGLDFYQPDYSTNTRPNYSRDNDEPSSEPDRLMIDNPNIMNADYAKSIQNFEANQNSNVSDYDRPNYSYNDASESDRNDSLSEHNPETNSVLDLFKDNCDTRINDESGEPDETIINERNSKNEEDSPAIETNDDADSIFKISDVLSEVPEETFQMLQASDILGTSTTVLETNEKLPPSLNFETNTELNVNSDNVATNHRSLVDEHNKSNESIKCKDYESTLGSKQSKKQNAEAPKTPSPVKPCRISVRNLSISELSNISALFNSPNTEVPETQINDDISMFTEPEKCIESPARLGISGIISRNRTSNITNKNTEIQNNPEVEKNDDRLEVLEDIKNKSSLKKSNSKSIEVSNADNKKYVYTNIETGVTTRKRSIRRTDNTKVITDMDKDLPKNSEITKIMTRNRSRSGTDNEDVIEKSKELTPNLEKSTLFNINQNAQVGPGPAIEKVKEASSLEQTGMITRNRCLSGTEDIEKSKEVSPKLQISEKNKKQKSRIGKSKNTNETIIEQSNDGSRLGISGMITRNRSVTGAVEVLEKSKEVTPKREILKKNRNQNAKAKDHTIEKVKEVSSLAISGMITRNRSLSGSENLEKSKEFTPNLETSKKKNSRGTRKSKNIDDTIIEKANEVSRLGVSGMITRNRSLSGTEDVVEKSKEVSPRKISKIKTRNQKSIIEQSNEGSSLEISGMITRNRRLSGTDNSIENIEHTEKSKDISPKKTSGDINKNITSPENLSKESVSIEPVGNVYNKISHNLDVEIKDSSENLKLYGWNKDDVNKYTLRKSIELSPVKPCLVSVEQVDVEPYERKKNSETNISGIEPLNVKIDKTAPKTLTDSFKTNAVDVSDEQTKALQSADITRKRSIIESYTDIPNVIEPHNKYANLKTYLRKTNTKHAALKKKSLSCIKKSTRSFINSFIETEPNYDNDSNQPSTKRVRKLSEKVLEHDNSATANTKEPRKQSISEIEHDYCGSDPSCDEESDTDMLFVDSVPAVDKYTKLFDKFEGTFDSSIFNKKILSNVVENITSSKPNTKTRSRKISLGELFGDDSDSDEPMVLQNNMREGGSQKYDTRKLSFTDPIDNYSTEKSPLKPCLRKSISYSPRNSKRKLSFSDPLSSDPEFNTCVSEPNSEDAIAGFLNDVAVPCKTLTKNIKKKQTTVNRSYGLRSRKNTNTKTAKKSKIIEQNKESRFTKIIPDKQTNTRNRSISSASNSESDGSVSGSRHNSITSKRKINKNKQKIQITSLRRSRRLSTRTNADNSEVKPTNTNAKESSEITKRRISDRSCTKENVQPKTKDTKNDISKSLLKNASKIMKGDKNRRKSLPSNIFSERTKKDLILRSKSLTNLNENTDRRTRHLSESNLYNTRYKAPKKYRSDSLQLSQRTKRYLRRVFNFDGSESDQSGDEISQRTERHIHRSIPISLDTKLSDTENKKSQRHTRSSMTLNSKETKTRSRNKTDYIEKTKRYTRRSAAAYSSCDEKLSAPVRRIKTKRPGKVNTNCSIDTVNTSAESNAEHLETDEIKTETEIDTTEVETFKIEINVTEETERVDSETLPVLHFIELPINSCEENASQANEIIDDNFNVPNNVHNNETDIEFDGRHSSTDAITVTHKSIEVNHREPNENSIEIQQIQNINTKCIYSVDDSDSSDFFNMCVNDEFNVLHFTATNDSDSEEEGLTIDDPQSNSNETVKQAKKEPHIPKTPQSVKTLFGESSKEQITPNKKAIQPKTPETVKCNLFGESTTEAKKVENIETQSPSVTPNKNLRNESSSTCTGSKDLSHQNKALENKSLPKDVVNDVIGVFNCTCKDTPFEVPPPRSFKKWRVRNKNSQIGFNVIIHSSHRVRKGLCEVLLEPIVEYQPELGGSRQPRGRLAATALAFMLRQNATLLNVRIDHDNGNVIVIDQVSKEEFTRRHGDKRSDVADTLHTALDQLRYLMPGQYVLAHDPSHGTNAMLYSTKGAHARTPTAPSAPTAPTDPSAPTLRLQLPNTNIPDAEDALYAKIPPELDLVMMPYHKHRSILPLSFTPHRLGIREEQKIAAALARARPPPSALQWPKKKKKSKKRSTRQNNRQQ